jgi:electron transport complex protein RnfG
MMQNEIVKLGIVLLIITSIAGGLLAFSNTVTADLIVEAEEAASSGPEVAMAVVPGSAKFVNIEEGLVEEIKSENDKFIDGKKAVDENGNTVG